MSKSSATSPPLPRRRHRHRRPHGAADRARHRGSRSRHHREDAVICGTAWFDAAFAALSPAAIVNWHVKDGDTVKAGDVLCDIVARARVLLTAERTALNFLQLLSGTATVTRRFVDAVAGTRARDRGHAQDPARPAPGAEVRDRSRRRHQPPRRPLRRHPDQGEPHHRCGRHSRSRGTGAQHRALNVFIEVEVENLDELREALDAGVTMVLLDNMSLDEMREAVAIAGRARAGSLRRRESGARARHRRDRRRSHLDRHPDQGRARSTCRCATSKTEHRCVERCPTPCRPGPRYPPATAGSRSTDAAGGG